MRSLVILTEVSVKRFGQSLIEVDEKVTEREVKLEVVFIDSSWSFAVKESKKKKWGSGCWKM